MKAITLSAIVILALGCKQEQSPINQVLEASSAQAIMRVHNAGYAAEITNRSADQYLQIDSIVLPANLDPKKQYIMYEGPALENDVIGYRLYADSRHRIDVFGKSVPDLVLDTVGWQYHDIMPWGSDILKVGTSLGMGSPAIYYSDSIYTLSNDSRKTIKTVSDGVTAGFVMTLEDLYIDSDTFTIKHTWTIQSGKPHAVHQLRVTDGELPEGAQFCTGIVKHIDTHQIARSNGKQALYTYGKQSFHEHNMGMAIVTDKTMQCSYKDDAQSHLWLLGTNRTTVSYEIAAAWELDQQGVTDQQQFESLILQ